MGANGPPPRIYPPPGPRARNYREWLARKRGRALPPRPIVAPATMEG